MVDSDLDKNHYFYEFAFMNIHSVGHINVPKTTKILLFEFSFHTKIFGTKYFSKCVLITPYKELRLQYIFSLARSAKSN